MSKLKDGLIPAGKECPFKDRCGWHEADACRRPLNMQNNFSCGLARGFDIFTRDRPERPIK